MKSLKQFKTQINEVLTKKTPLSQWIHDFVHSDDPKFDGKSKDERIKMAQGAYYGAQKEAVEKATGELKDACWKGYTAVGTKKKNGRTVPNCVPVNEDGSEITIGEGKMAELHASLSQHLDKHVAEYKRAGGAESLGHKSTVAAQKISKEHGIAPHHAQKFVNDYIENKLKESMKEDIKAERVREAVEYKGIGTDVVDKKKKLNPQPNLLSTKKTVKDFKEELDLIEAMTDKDKLKQALDRHTEKAVAANKCGDDEACKVHQGYINKIKTKMGKLAKEEVEQIDEISRKTMTSYISKAEDDVLQKQKAIKNSPTNSLQLKHSRAMDLYKRYGNINKAYKKVIAKEETETKQEYQAKKKEQLKKYDWVEKLYKSAPKDVKDKNPYKKEEVEQIDELSKGTLSSYVKKAHKDNAMTANDLGHQLAMSKKPGLSAGTDPTYTKGKNKYLKRSDNIDKAVSKLAKEEVELEESRGHKVIATFLKNREVAQRAYQGNPAKDAEVAQGGGSPADQGIAAAKKDYKKLNKEGVSMLNFNDFLKEGKCGSMKKEELKGNQHKLDKNKNGKLDGDDFKKLRGENKDCDYEEEGFVSHAQRKAVWASKNEKGVKEEVKDKKDSPPFDPDPKPTKKVTPGKFGQGYSQAKHLAQKGLKSLTKEDLDQFSAEDIEEFMMSEDYDQLDEISKETLASYIPKAAKSARIHGQISTEYKKASERKKNPGLIRALDSLSTKYKKKAWDREDNIKKAVGKLTKEDTELTMDELVEYMQTEAWKKMDEVSKSTLASYVKKSHDQLMKHTGSVNMKFGRGDKDAVAYSLDKTALRKTANRTKGMDTAINKLAKEEIDFDEAEKVSYTQFIKSIEEGKIDDYLDKKRADANTASAYDKKKTSTKQPSVTINKGRAYGGSNQKDDEGDEKPETAEKRGRGRPTGSKSGARQKGNGHNDGGIPVHNLNLPTRNNKF